MLNVDSLKRSIVIDHIKAGSCMDIYKYLELDKLDCSVAIIKNAKSNAMGKKDIIKVEGLLDIDLDVLGFIDCDITVNVIDDGKIIEKKKLTMPETIRNVVSCKNPRCITSIERGIDQVFKLSDRENHVYRCAYCEQKYEKNKNSQSMEESNTLAVFISLYDSIFSFCERRKR